MLSCSVKVSLECFWFLSGRHRDLGVSEQISPQAKERTSKDTEFGGGGGVSELRNSKLVSS